MYFAKYKSPKTESIPYRFFNTWNERYPRNESIFFEPRQDTGLTEVLHDIGTTDMAIGDATAEIMNTTTGSIPNVWYDLGETTVNSSIKSMKSEILPIVSTSTTIVTEIQTETEINNDKTLFTILAMCLIVTVLLCLIIMCTIAVSRRRSSTSSELNCDPDCVGAKRPLLSRPGKFSRSTSKSSILGRH
ncbi:uncharacterized protein [Fopius arisanus]|uniref:Uncharacterized protein n=1 Tax=Fopius arisanus TaxID=64838 RepID=A0A0C9RL91_9HYME|nr:PREDICTED: uncharacterized protein LOC105264541 [Fopius arisanus]